MNKWLNWLGVTVEEESHDEITDLRAVMVSHQKAAERAEALAKQSQTESYKLTQLATSALDILDRAEKERKKYK